MNSNRVSSQEKALHDSQSGLDAVQAPGRGADLSSLERARMLVTSKFSEDERAHEFIKRGTEAAERLGKLGMGGETLATALLLPLVEDGALDPAAIEKSVGVEVARLTQGPFVSPALKTCAKPQARFYRRIVCGRCF
jgi:(p)ppGpp synthase/HD superfamily hydrolase